MSEVKKIMEVSGDYILDLNDVTKAGVYLLDGYTSPKNCPPKSTTWSMGILEVFTRYGDPIFQRATSINGEVAVRVHWKENWTDWRVL